MLKKFHDIKNLAGHYCSQIDFSASSATCFDYSALLFLSRHAVHSYSVSFNIINDHVIRYGKTEPQ